MLQMLKGYSHQLYENVASNLKLLLTAIKPI